MNQYTIRFSVNGRPVAATVEPRRLLSDTLRDDLGLTGTHVGCEQGVCGACTVILDGVAVRSCLLLAVQVEGSEVRTVEGLMGPEGDLHPVQQALRDTHGFQCGFCAPGFLMTITALMDEGVDLGEPVEIREALSGNVCRCTGYQSIVDGVLLAHDRSSASIDHPGGSA